MEFRETGCVGVNWIYPVQDRVERSCEHGNECLSSIICKEFFINQVTVGLLRQDWLFVVNLPLIYAFYTGQVFPAMTFCSLASFAHGLQKKKT
jgi:hypothetical protein